MPTALLDDELWRRVEPLLPIRRRRFYHPGRKRLDDRCTLSGILFVLRTGIAWQQLPQELGYGSGMTCWRRLKEWQQAGVFQALHERLLAELRAAGRLDLSRAVCDSASLRALLGAIKPAPGCAGAKRVGLMTAARRSSQWVGSSSGSSHSSSTRARTDASRSTTISPVSASSRYTRGASTLIGSTPRTMNTRSSTTMWSPSLMPQMEHAAVRAP